MHHHGHHGHHGIHHDVHGHIHHHGIHHGHAAHIGAGAAHHHHRTIIYPPFQPKADQVLALDIDGDDDKFGCAATCGCTPNVAKIPRQYHVPQGAEDLITVEDLNVLADEVNRILETNYIPPFPLIFLHFCLPFSPICIMGSYSSSKQKALKELLETKNATMKNCHWELNSDAFLIPNYPLLSLIAHGPTNHATVNAIVATAVPVGTIDNADSQY